ncbi:hypothetical protein P3G55_06780 [Leptospira sp. 96542]|nr:hypothetical protein [Leptospira sp. 96542]
MRISPPKDSFLNLTTKESLGRSSGIILQKDALTIMKVIEAQSTKEKYEAGYLFQAHPQNFEKLKLTDEVGLDQLWQIIDYGIATQLFALKYREETEELDIIPFVAGIPDGMQMEDAYRILIRRSVENLRKYIFAKRVLTEDLWRSVLNKLTDLEYDVNSGSGDELDKLLVPKRFPLQPSSEMLNRSRGLIMDEMEKDPKIIVLPHIGFFTVSELNVSTFLTIANEYFVAKVEPVVRNFDPEIRIALDQAYTMDDSSVTQEFSTVALIKRKIEALNGFLNILYEKGFHRLILNLEKISELATKQEELDKKKEVDKLLKVYLKMLDSQFDFDSRLLRINLEKDNEHDTVIVDLLRKNPNILSAEWHDADSKLAIFVLNQPTNIKGINSLIFEKYRFTTEYILYLKAIIETNEKELKPLFKDEEFTKNYGRNLQSVYFNYIPWFYKVFHFLGVSPVVNTGYAKAKSIITYTQMDRQFQYEKRRANYYKKKMREREDRLEREKKLQYKRALIAAIMDAFIEKSALPKVDWIQVAYPAFTQEILEKMLSDFGFVSTTGKSISPESIILLPKSEECELKNRELKDLVNRWIRGEEETIHPNEVLVEIRNLL